MQAIVISTNGGPGVLTVAELPDPVPAVGEILIWVRAFGLNHAEAYMRSGAWGEVTQIPGIKCAGMVEADPSGVLAEGTAVVAIIGGMGRTRNGSYAQLVTAPASNVVPVRTSLSWTDLVALPEVYTTAWAGLQNLGLRPGQRPRCSSSASASVSSTGAPRPRQELHLKDAFKPCDRLGQAGLGDVQAGSWPPEMQLFGHHDEVAQEPELDVSRLVIPLGGRRPDDALPAGLSSCRGQGSVNQLVLLGVGGHLRVIAAAYLGCRDIYWRNGRAAATFGASKNPSWLSRTSRGKPMTSRLSYRPASAACQGLT